MKQFIKLGIVFLVLIGCTKTLTLEKESVNTEISFLPLGVYLEIQEFNNGQLSIQISNQSGYETYYTDSYILEKEENGKWIEIDKKEAKEKHSLQDLENVDLVLEFSSSLFDVGNYRISIDDLTEEFTLK